MIATFRSCRSSLTSAAFTALLVAAFAFLAAVVVGGAAPSLIAAAAAFGVTGALLAISHWRSPSPYSSVSNQQTAPRTGTEIG